MMPFDISSKQHRVFGQQVVLQFTGDFILKLTQAEASSLSFALLAVRNGASFEREIYMSPIASDAAFAGTVHDNGVKIVCPTGMLELDWTTVVQLAGAIAAAIN